MYKYLFGSKVVVSEEDTGENYTAQDLYELHY